eukprot:2985065-Pyramimonas_sp.AAC.1
MDVLEVSQSSSPSPILYPSRSPPSSPSSSSCAGPSQGWQGALQVPGQVPASAGEEARFPGARGEAGPDRR